MKWIQFIRNWSEVWALLIPLIVIVIQMPKEKNVRPLIWYVIIAFFLNFTATFMVEYYYLIPEDLQNNNLLYNLHSVTRVILICWYISKITPRRFIFINKATLLVYIIFVLVNFIFFESPFILSTRLFASESIILLFLCISFFLRSMQDESGTDWISHPTFLVCTGVSIYEAITFFIFLFIYPIADKNPEFGKISMEIYRVIFIIFCILLAWALFRSKKLQLIKN